MHGVDGYADSARPAPTPARRKYAALSRGRLRGRPWYDSFRVSSCRTCRAWFPAGDAMAEVMQDATLRQKIEFALSYLLRRWRSLPDDAATWSAWDSVDK